MNITAELINGICLGIEHISLEEDEQEDDDYYYPKWGILINLLLFRILLLKY